MNLQTAYLFLASVAGAKEHHEETKNAKRGYLSSCLVAPMFQFWQSSFNILPVTKWAAFSSKKKAATNKEDN